MKPKGIGGTFFIGLILLAFGLVNTAALAQDTVIIGMHQELEFLNVIYTQGGNSLSASKLAQRGLLFLDEDSNWVGELATQVPSVSNGGISEDGTAITFNLREGVTWHDGNPVTSADVKATWDMIMNPDNAVITRFGYDRITSIDTPDDLTVVLNFDAPFTSWPILFDAIVPLHVIEANSPDLDRSQAMRTPIGFGPFRISQWRTGEFIEYEAFDDYWRGRPQIDRLVIQIYPSVDALMQAVAAKEVDMAWSLPASFVPQIRALEDQGIRLVTTGRATAERYVMNADAENAPLFADQQLRQALHHAIDKQLIVDELLFGLADVAVSEWQGSPWQNPDLVAYDYDPELAAQMLDDLGWIVGADGIREKDGQRLSFVHKTTVGNLLRENVQLLVQQLFGDIGVEMIIENQRTADLFGSWQQGGQWSQGNYQMGGWSHGLRVPDPEISNRFLCSEIASETNESGSQWFRYCNPAVDALLEEQAITLDADARKQLIFDAQEIFHDDAYVIYLYAAPLIYTAREELQNFTLHRFADFYWNPHEWSLE